jgi:hypothetical protein
MLSSTGLNGPYELAFDVIQDEIAESRPGAYALGYTDARGRFCITFVGSAKGDLKASLNERIGTAHQFKFSYFQSEKAAFEKECELFHKFMPPGNFLHPERPASANWRCPKCSMLVR